MGRAGDVVLTLAAVAGAVCLVATASAFVLHLGLILFRTGSMSPGIPAGSVALVRELPASEVGVGEVVTVDRPGALPVTHRVVSARPLPDGRTELVLRGDANRQNDPGPYRVRTVRVVLGSVPGGAHAIGFLSSPFFLGSATLAATALVGWAFWPRGGRVSRAAGESARPARRGVQALAVIGAIVGLTAGGLASSDAAHADEATTFGRYITLTSAGDRDGFTGLTPGATVRWLVGVAASPPTPGTIHLGIASEGDAEDALILSVTSCDARWVGTRCPGKATPAVTARPVSSFRTASFGSRPPAIDTMPSGEQRWLALDVTLDPATAATAPAGAGPGGLARLAVWAWGAGDEASTSQDRLPSAGSSAPLTPLLLAAASVLGGTCVAALARRRRAS
ncbi:hypothetical protein [Leifsonia xyli]|uniref:hypothetical protein n=1 Tax=Leifsonia xyli TaxID=1575 RepID=UPI003D6782D0